MNDIDTAPTSKRAARWARIGLIFIAGLFACIGAGALYGFLTR